MSTPNQQNLIQQNLAYAAKFNKGHLPSPPDKKYLIVTCMDARIDPALAYGIDVGDAHVIRNAGGNIKDALRSIIISNQMLGTKEIMLIKHTGCGMLTFKNQDAVGIVTKNLGPAAGEAVKDLDFQPFADLDQSVRDDVHLLRKTPVVADNITMSGWVYQVENGKLRQVV